MVLSRKMRILARIACSSLSVTPLVLGAHTVGVHSEVRAPHTRLIALRVRPYSTLTIWNHHRRYGMVMNGDLLMSRSWSNASPSPSD